MDIWSTPLDVPDGVRARLVDTLSEDERVRADRFYFERDRRHFQVARGMVRHLLGHVAGLGPGAVSFHYGPRGKPSVDGLEFNLSHSGELALLGVSFDQPLGVDIERCRPMPDAEAIARRFFSPRECEALLALPAEAREEAFFRCWTRKEAYIKALGSGLMTSLQGFSVDVGEVARILEIAGDDPRRWTMHRWRPAPGYHA
ncbi:MAG TPA: 4'-phosphopantetheinyl transferase superfamily protein, partial [Candidatus Xenobia bacterium]